MTQTKEIELRLINRIPKPWGRYISCQEGWYKILGELDDKLSYLDPEYQINQVKEKFGTLRFYFETTKDIMIRDIMDNCVSAATYASSYTCEYCGSNLGKLQESNWLKTACDTCWSIKQKERKKRDQALDELIQVNQELGLYDKELP